jgi:hypothetical protein
MIPITEANYDIIVRKTSDFLTAYSWNIKCKTINLFTNSMIGALSTTLRCVCRNPKFNNPNIATFPKAWIHPLKPLTTTDVDFAEPLSIRKCIQRVISIKALIAVFVVCMSTRAIHIELVELALLVEPF